MFRNHFEKLPPPMPLPFQVEADGASGIAERTMCGIGSFEICARAGFEVRADHTAKFLGFPIVGRLAAPGARKADFVAGDTKSWRGICGAGTEHAGEQVIACGADVLHARRIPVRAQVALDKNNSSLRERHAFLKGSVQRIPIGDVFSDASIMLTVRPQHHGVRGEFHVFGKRGEFVPIVKTSRGVMSRKADRAGDFQTALAVDERENLQVVGHQPKGAGSK